MKIEKIDILKIKEYENNTKIHTQKQIDEICQSIKKFGNNDPIAIDENNVVIEGHGRLIALKKLGYKEVEIIRLSHLNKQQKKAYILAHNKLTLATGFDMDLLTIELSAITDFDMTEFGFDEISFENKNYNDEDIIDEITENATIEECNVRLGDIYKLGNHFLMCGDSTKKEDVEKLVKETKINLLVTDPPYNVNYEEKEKSLLKYQKNKRVNENKNTKIANDNMSNEEFRTFLNKVYLNADLVMKEGAAFYIWHATNESYNFIGAAQDIGWKIRQTLVWVKNNFVLGRQDYQWKHEPCLYGWKEGASHFWNSDRKQTTVLEFDKPTKSELHPTMKPLDLIKYIIKNSSKKNDDILDLFGGSGTTLIAAEELQRNCYMMEFLPEYVNIIIKRWETMTGQKAIKVS
mgnify:CR=1 FL=1